MEACAHQQAAAGWRGEGERIRSALADARQQLQETHASHGNTVNWLTIAAKVPLQVLVGSCVLSKQYVTRQLSLISA